MPSGAWDLAQLNIGITVAPLNSEALAGFVEALDPINAIADAAPGFVWRLDDEAVDEAAKGLFDNDQVIVNMSTWRSLESLNDFVYRTGHVEVLRKRRDYFELLDDAFVVLWWVPAGHRPSLLEAKEHLDQLRAQGPSPGAFTLRAPFPSPDSPVE